MGKRLWWEYEIAALDERADPAFSGPGRYLIWGALIAGLCLILGAFVDAFIAR